MKIDILTLFPKMFQGPFQESLLKRAQEKGLVEIKIHNLRKWAKDKHKTVDDRPYGGGPGMILMPQPVFDAVKSLKSKVPAKGWSASGRKSQKLSWVLQQFRPQNCLDKKFLKIKPYSRKEMKDILKAVKEILPGVKLRGDD